MSAGVILYVVLSGWANKPVPVYFPHAPREIPAVCLIPNEPQSPRFATCYVEDVLYKNNKRMYRDRIVYKGPIEVMKET